MSYADLHTHTVFCDGKNTPEEMVLSAIEKGLSTLGIVAHSFVEFDPEFCISPEREEEFIFEVRRLKAKYKDKINILCGSETDFYTTSVSSDYDYRIGSVHYFCLGGKYYPIDMSEKTFIGLVQEHFGGDYYSAAEEYYSLVSKLWQKCQPDIIGHIDLISKFNEGDKLFDTSHPRYVRAYRAAVDALVGYGKPFEINTGAISRGYRTEPYPSCDIQKYIKEKGGSLILSSDAHCAEDIAYKFEDL